MRAGAAHDADGRSPRRAGPAPLPGDDGSPEKFTEEPAAAEAEHGAGGGGAWDTRAVPASDDDDDKPAAAAGRAEGRRVWLPGRSPRADEGALGVPADLPCCRLPLPPAGASLAGFDSELVRPDTEALDDADAVIVSSSREVPRTIARPLLAPVAGVLRCSCD